MLRIADFSRVLAGPYATMLLADFGAEVIKVERPGGDDTRHWGPPYAADGQATYFAAVNRNKRSVVIDLASEAGREEARRLIAASDVVVENFAAGTMAKFGLDYATVSQQQPELVYCSITGFGASGEGAAIPGYDLLVQAMGGLMSITGEDAEHPTKAGVALVDVITGLHAVIGIQQALLTRAESGEGQWVQVNLLSSLLSALVNQGSAWVAGGVTPRAMGNAHPSIVPYELFAAQDRAIVLAVGTDAQFAALCEVLGKAEWASDERFATNPARVANREALVPAIAAVLGQRTAEAWLADLSRRRVPSGPVNTIAEAFALAERLGLAPVAEVGGVATIANPIQFSKTPVTYRLAPPALPEETR